MPRPTYTPVEKAPAFAGGDGHGNVALKELVRLLARQQALTDHEQMKTDEARSHIR